MFVIFKKNLTKSRKSCLTEKGSSPWHPCKCILLSIHWYDLLAPLNGEGDWVGSGWPKTQKNWLLYMGLEPEVPETSLPISRSFHTLTWGVGFFIIRHRYVLYLNQWSFSAEGKVIVVANDGEPCSAVQFFRVSLSGGPGTGTCMFIFDITWYS